jgi:alpha-tubulin suppressor-like RCC1 family protein
MGSFSTNEKIKIIESIEKVNVEISKRNQKYEKDLKKLKEDYIQDLNVFEDFKLKLKENLNMLKELKLNLKSSNILTLLKIKNEIKFDTVHEEYFKEIYSFGRNCEGELGLGNTTNQSIPKLISFLKNKKIKNVSCGRYHTIITTGNLIFYLNNRKWCLFFWWQF